MKLLIRFFLLFILIFINIQAVVAHQSNLFYRDFWQPTFHGLRLNYCSTDGMKCGDAIAQQYCQKMGYDDVRQQTIDYSVGLTNFLVTPARCKGWQCDGFKLIRCVRQLSHHPAKSYHYRLRQFVYPRYEFYRVAWCYDGVHGCGRQAAYSFCRRMGYSQVQHYAIHKGIAATKAIANQKLCFGRHCKAFKFINCFR